METGQAQLYINDELVGSVAVRTKDTSWAFGEFFPNPAFSKYAPLFGNWSVLMHEDNDQKLHEAAADELRQAEMAIDKLEVRVYYPSRDVWQRAAQINIDGSMIEWKLY